MSLLSGYSDSDCRQPSSIHKVSLDEVSALLHKLVDEVVRLRAEVDVIRDDVAKSRERAA